MSSPENLKTWAEIMNWEWDDYDDYIMKYVENNEEAWAKRISIVRRHNTMGLFLRDNRIDSELLYDYTGPAVILTWNKFGPICKETRVRNGTPDLLKWFEYLADEMNKIRLNRGITTPIHTTSAIAMNIPDE